MGLDNPLHLAFIVVILLLVFGARRLPEIGRSLGSGMREFKDAITTASETKSHALGAGTQQPQAQAPVNVQPPMTAQPPQPTATPAPAAPAPVPTPAPPQPQQPPPEPVAAQPGASGEQQPNPFGR
jgi:sec-independent protein translocase protein TatA